MSVATVFVVFSPTQSPAKAGFRELRYLVGGLEVTVVSAAMPVQNSRLCFACQSAAEKLRERHAAHDIRLFH